MSTVLLLLVLIGLFGLFGTQRITNAWDAIWASH